MPPPAACKLNALLKIMPKALGILLTWVPMAISAMMMNSSDINGTSMLVTLPMRWMPPMMMTAAIAATIMPTTSLTVQSSLKLKKCETVCASVPEILFVCTPLMPIAAKVQKTAAQ